jgi:AcrR family transcriptional regulator
MGDLYAFNGPERPLEARYPGRMTYDPESTKTKFLDPAFAEFVEHGLAGARVDRIATTAGANKQAIYAYFGCSIICSTTPDS